MNTLEIIPASGPSLELLIAGGVAIELTSPVQALEITHSGMQGARGFTGRFAYDVVAAPISGQVAFQLLTMPADPAKVRMLVNSNSYGAPDIVVTGRDVMWTEPFTIEASDSIEFQYPVQETP